MSGKTVTPSDETEIAVAIAAAEQDLATNWAPCHSHESTCRALLAALKKANDEEEFNYALIGRLGKILGDTANAMKGQPDELALHSTHDLAPVAARLVAQRDSLVSALSDARDALTYYAELHPVAESAITESMTAREAIVIIDAALSKAEQPK